MESYRDNIVREIRNALIPAIVVAIILIIALFLARRFLVWAELPRAQVPVCLIISILFLVNILWTYLTVSKLFLDLSNNSFETYVGEVEFMDQKSSKYTDVFCLRDLDNMYVECGYGSIDSTIQRCKAQVIYAKHSKKLLDIEVHEIIETRSPIIFR